MSKFQNFIMLCSKSSFGQFYFLLSIIVHVYTVRSNGVLNPMDANSLIYNDIQTLNIDSKKQKKSIFGRRMFNSWKVLKVTKSSLLSSCNFHKNYSSKFSVCQRWSVKNGTLHRLISMQILFEGVHLIDIFEI